MSTIKTKLVGRDLTTGANIEQDILAKNTITQKHIAGAVVFSEPFLI